MRKTALPFKLPIISIGLFLLLNSCTTFVIPVESLKTQIAEANEANIYLSSKIDSLIVVGKDGKRYAVANSPSLEMRITKVNGKTHILYFDTITIEDNLLKGSPSRLLSGIMRKIPLDSIAKIEIQNGKKNFRYLQE